MIIKYFNCVTLWGFVGFYLEVLKLLDEDFCLRIILNHNKMLEE